MGGLQARVGSQHRYMLQFFPIFYFDQVYAQTLMPKLRYRKVYLQKDRIVCKVCHLQYAT